jgi:glycerol-3-phosphate dehydrogenase (NAD(P)+)
MSNCLTLAVLGGGSFGTVIANTIASNGYETYLWMRDVEKATRCQKTRENAEYLPGYKFAETLTVTADINRVVAESTTVFISVPSSSFREVICPLKTMLMPGTYIISTTKGIESNKGIESKGFTLMSQILKQELPGFPIGVLSGPNFAKEIVQKHLTGSVVASEDDRVVRRVQQVLSSETFRIYSNSDCYGVELAGALKNIYAILSGMAKARGYGHNTMAMLMTRALAEMGRFAQALGANPITFLGLAGVGDLILTCTSDLSRNFRLGYLVGSGIVLKAALREIRQVVEGVNTLRLVKAKTEELNIDMPLVSGLYALLFEGQPADKIIKQLMLAEQANDVDFTGVLL